MEIREIMVRVSDPAVTADDILDTWATEARAKGIAVERVGLPKALDLALPEQQLAGLIRTVEPLADYELVLGPPDESVHPVTRWVWAWPAAPASQEQVVPVATSVVVAFQLNSPLMKAEHNQLAAVIADWFARLFPNQLEWPTVVITTDGLMSTVEMTITETYLSAKAFAAMARALIADWMEQNPRPVAAYLGFALIQGFRLGAWPPYQLRFLEPVAA